MAYRISQDPLPNPSPKHTLSPKQTQHIMQSPEMQQALKLLQLPQLELSQYLTEEMENNPLLEVLEENEGTEEQDEKTEEEGDGKEMDFEKDDFSLLSKIDDEFADLIHDAPPLKKSRDEQKRESFLESAIIDEPTLQEFLLQQTADLFETERELQLAGWLIGFIDEGGFIATPLEEIASTGGYSLQEVEKVLLTLQSFDPPGLFARDVRESLLLQLERKGAKGTLAWRLVQEFWESLLKNEIPLISKRLKIPPPEIDKTLEMIISKLDRRPGLSLSKKPTPYIVPDLLVQEQEGTLTVTVNQDFLPSISLNRGYLKLLRQETLPQETRDFIEQKMRAADWLLRTVKDRSSTIERVMSEILKIDKSFFLEPDGKIKPLTLKVLAERLGLHESTIARAVQNKYVQTPRGILSLRSFFTTAFAGREGEEVSSQTIKEILKEAIEKEDKTSPLSDETLSKILQGKGIQCARRTVAKFRAALNFGNRHQRRKY